MYMMRHGIALDRLGGGITSDSQRPLTDEGREETRMVAHALKKIGVRADLVVSSPLIRARQTGEIISEVIGGGQKLEITDALAPAGSTSSLYKFMKQFTKVEEVFFVGHEPDIGRLVATLIWAGPEVDIPFKKAGVCRVDVVDLPPTIPGTLKWSLTPKICNAIVNK